MSGRHFKLLPKTKIKLGIRFKHGKEKQPVVGKGNIISPAVPIFSASWYFGLRHFIRQMV